MKPQSRPALFLQSPHSGLIACRLAATGALILLACAWPNLGRAQDQSGPTGKFSVRETWSATIAEDNGQTPTFSKTYHGTASGTLSVSNGYYTLISRLPGATAAERDTVPAKQTWGHQSNNSRRIYWNGVGYEVDGSYPVTGFSGSYAILKLSFFEVAVPLPVRNYAIPALGGGNVFTTTGDSLGSLSGAGDENDPNTGFTASASSSSSLNAGATPGTLAPRVTVQPRSQSASLDDNLTLTVSATGTEPLSYHWTHDGVNLVDGGEFSGSATAVLTIQGVQAADAGTYRVVVSNAKGSVTSRPATLTIGAVLGIEITGPGAVTPNYNGKSLIVGKKYTVAAKPAKGCKFMGWTGSANSTSPRLTFTMEPDFTFTASFEDSQRPLLKIVSPKARQATSTAVLALTGKASDNVGVEAVYYEFDGGAWALAQGTTAWSAPNLDLTPGAHMLRAYAVDAAGNASLTNSVSFTYLVSAPLSVTVSPPEGGTVTPNYNGRLLQIGKTYPMTAKPAKGFSFVNWTGSAETTSPRLTFVMASNLTFTANFNATQQPGRQSFTLADYFPLPLGAQWLYTGTNNDGNPAYLQDRVQDTNFSLTLYTGAKPVRALLTNCVELAAAYLDYSTMTPYESWDEYWLAGPRVGSFGDDDPPDESIRVSGRVAFPAQMAVGTAVTLTANAYSFGKPAGTATVSLRLLEHTVLTVPAGTFPDVLHLRETMSGAGSRPKVQDWWWARGVGKIKDLGITGTSDSWELSSYSIPEGSSSARSERLSQPATLPALRLSAGTAASREGSFGFYVTGPPGQVVIVEISADLVHWAPVETNTLTAGPLYFSDPQGANQPWRFYRASTP
jgi:uncharacterized repeat protein (TIGR02543 family)